MFSSEYSYLGIVILDKKATKIQCYMVGGGFSSFSLHPLLRLVSYLSGGRTDTRTASEKTLYHSSKLW